MNSVDRIFVSPLDFADAATWEHGGRLWPSGEQQTLTCCRVIDETHDVRSFEFRTEDGLPVRFEPGQSREVSLIPFAGARRIYGFSGGVMGPLESGNDASGANE